MICRFGFWVNSKFSCESQFSKIFFCNENIMRDLGEERELGSHCIVYEGEVVFLCQREVGEKFIHSLISGSARRLVRQFGCELAGGGQRKVRGCRLGEG